jgi:hypothetical protein
MTAARIVSDHKAATPGRKPRFHRSTTCTAFSHAAFRASAFRISSAAPAARVGSLSGRLRLRHVGGRLASRMRWDKHICSELFGFPPEGPERLIPRASTWIGCALFDF